MMIENTLSILPFDTDEQRQALVTKGHQGWRLVTVVPQRYTDKYGTEWEHLVAYFTRERPCPNGDAQRPIALTRLFASAEPTGAVHEP